MSINPISGMFGVLDTAPYVGTFGTAVSSAVAGQASSNEPPTRISDLASEIDATQAKVIEDTLRERVRVNTYSAGHDPNTEVRIGLTWMKVPPSSIRIKDVRMNDSIPGLRSTANALIKTGRGRIVIDMTLDFPDQESINNELRYIIAQFKATPFLPIESQYIYNAIMAHAAQVDPKVLDTLKLKLDRVWKDYVRVKEQMVSVVVANPQIIASAHSKYPLLSGDDIAAKFQNMLPSDLILEVTDLVAKLTSNKASRDLGSLVSVWGGGQSVSIQILSELTALATSGNGLLAEIKGIYKELSNIGVPEASRRPVVHVVLHTMQIMMVPGEVDSIKVKLSMLYFAYGAYVSELTYKNSQGFPTPDIAECPYFDYYLQRRFLQGSMSGVADTEKVPRGQRYLGTYSHEGGLTWLFKYPTPRFEQVADDKPCEEDLVPPIRAENIGGGRAYNLAAKSNSSPQRTWRALNESLSILPDDDVIVPQQVVITIQNRIALQPIQSSMYGTAQHMGSMNATVSVAFSVTGDDKSQHDLGVARLQRMKLESERVALIGGPKIRRNSKISIKNDILALVGIQYVQIDSISVRNNPGEIWSSTVQLDLSEYTISQEKREVLRLQNTEPWAGLMYGSLSFAFDVVDKYLRGDSGSKRGYLALSSDAGRYCRTVLYGSDKRGDEGGLSKNLLTYVLMNRPDVRGLLINYIRGSAFNSASSSNPITAEDPNRMGFSRRVFEERGDSGLNLESGNLSDFLNRTRSLPNSSLARQIYGVGPGGKASSDPKYLESRLSEECRRLAGEMLEFWRQSKIQLTRGNSSVVPTVIRDSKNVIDIETTPQAFLHDIVRSSLENPDLSDEYMILARFGQYCLSNFEEVQQYYQGRLEDIRGDSNYPDLDLPTYADVFLGSKEAVSSALGVPIDDMEIKLLRVFTYRYMGDKTTNILRRFVPTYRDIGKRAPLNQDPYSLARKLTDFVDPDFFYYHNRVSQTFDSFASEVENEADNLYSPSSRVTNYDQGQKLADKVSLADAARIQKVRGVAADASLRFIDSKEDITANIDDVPDPSGSSTSWFFKGGVWHQSKPRPGFGTEDFHRYTSGDPAVQDAIGKFSHDSPGHLQNLFQETVKSQKDNTDRMIRAFPTFKLEFIEVDNEDWTYWDDFYSYNSVIDFQMSEHKFEPALLQIRIMNTTGNLDEARSAMEDPDKIQEDASWINPDGSFKDPRAPIGSPHTEAGTGEPRQLSKFFLQTGTNIRLRVGYGSMSDDLEIKFVGQIAEVRPGDITTLICQSYKNELTVPLNTYKSGYESDAWDVIKYIMKESPTTHFGGWSPFESDLFPNARNSAGEKINLQSSERLGWGGYRAGPDAQSEAYSKQREAYLAPISEVSGLFIPEADKVVGGAASLAEYTYSPLVAPFTAARFLANLSSDRKLSNVYVPRHSAWRELFSTAREFLIPDRSGLEVLHELTRMMPGYVFDVRTYEPNNVTLFFGKPEQRYFFTGLKQNEERLWQQVQDRKSPESSAAEQSLIRLMVAFEDSPEATVFRAGLQSRHSDGKERAKSWSKWVGSVPGKIIGGLTFGLLGKDYEKAGETIGLNTFFGSYESPDVTTQLGRVETNLGSYNMKAVLAYFFNRYVGEWDSGRAGVEVTMGVALVVASYGMLGVRSVRRGIAAAASGPAAGDQVGTLFASMVGWHEKMVNISAVNNGTTEFNNNLRYNTFDMSTDFKMFNSMRDTNAGVTDALGRQVNRERYESSVNAIIDYIPEWKDFITWFDVWIQRKIAEQDVDMLKEVYKAGRLLERFEHNPRTKKFRGHHYVDSIHHIIHNGITATKEQMANTVVIKYPDDVDYNEGGGKYYVAQNVGWNGLEMMADQNIQPSEKKVRLVTEINADDSRLAGNAAASNLAEALRPMYRGELILRGDEAIKPWDVVWINDHYENIYGPVEVERLITHFGSETGYTVTVIPQLVAIPKSRSSWIDSLSCGQINAIKSILGIPGALSEGMSHAGISTEGQIAIAGGAGLSLFNPVLAPITVTVAAAGLVGGGLYQGFALKEQTGAGIFGNLTGRGKYGRDRTPVDIIPLVRNGIPWTAGLRGWGDNNWRLRIFKQWSDLTRGVALTEEAYKASGISDEVSFLFT